MGRGLGLKGLALLRGFLLLNDDANIFSWEKWANLGGTGAGTGGASPIEGLASAQ